MIKANERARRYLGGAEPDGFVRFLSQSVSDKPPDLRRQVREAAAGGARTALLLRTVGQRSLICNIQPLHRPEPAGGPGCALVALSPLMGGSSEVVPHLRALFKLSKAEAEIAAAAASGIDVVQMAQARQVSIHTLRAQIAAIKAKMGLSRMTEIAVTVGRIEAALGWL